MGNSNYTSWTFIDLAAWKLLPLRFGGGKEYIQRFKDDWVIYSRLNIKRSADMHQIPPELRGGTAWLEVGGDPQIIVDIVYDVRSFDWSGPK